MTKAPASIVTASTPELDEDPERLPPGTPVGEYLLGELLGSGGFARVYQGRHPVLRSQVAIKVITRALALDPDASQRFVREALAASKIAHPGVVRVLGFGKLPDGRAYQVMELVEGPALDDYLAEHGPLPLAEALRLLEAIADALDAAHAAGIVHRDLKPANILLAPGPGGPRPRLADFGIAKAVEFTDAPNLTRTGTTLGTPVYMSPEQALGRPIGAASDVYSFGVVAFELITGKVPFESDSPLETMMHHVQTTAPAPSSVLPGLGPRFDAALAALLAKTPGARPPTVAAAMRSLRSLRTSPAPSAARPGSGRRWAIGAAVAALVAALAAAGVIALPDRKLASAPPAAPAPVVSPVPPPPALTNAPLPEEMAQARSAAARPTAAATRPAIERRNLAAPRLRPASVAPDAGLVGAGPAGSDSIEIPDDYEP